jgi:hypothetical protein
MPHFKCVGCKTRLYSAAGPANLAGDLCTGCGSLLEPVGELAEIVGFQLITHRDSAADDGRPRSHQQIADQLDGLFARREAAAEAIALPAPRETP